MRLRFAGVAAGLLIVAGCAEMTSDPVTEEIFVNQPPAPTVAATIAPVDPVAVTPIEPGGVDPALALVEVDPYDTVEDGGGTDGLTERLPDTCRLHLYQQYNGQTADAVNAAGLTVPYRVVGPTDIVSQEYNPLRVNFFLSGTKVGRISCG